jgi:hypothetical protein
MLGGGSNTNGHDEWEIINHILNKVTVCYLTRHSQPHEGKAPGKRRPQA